MCSLLHHNSCCIKRLIAPYDKHYFLPMPLPPWTVQKATITLDVLTEELTYSVFEHKHTGVEFA